MYICAYNKVYIIYTLWISMTDQYDCKTLWISIQNKVTYCKLVFITKSKFGKGISQENT